MTSRKYLVQSVISALGVATRPHVVWLSPDGTINVDKMERETPSTIAFNGALLLLTSSSAMHIVEANRGDSPSMQLRALHSALSSAGMLASQGAEDVIPLLVPFDGSPCRTLDTL